MLIETERPESQVRFLQSHLLSMAYRNTPVRIKFGAPLPKFFLFVFSFSPRQAA